jgi:glycosyltransferase involved in cell wall biosynthesis
MKISIIVPNYNKEKYLSQCLESCLNQTYENIELIFIDNESKDNSLSVAKKIKQTTKKDFIIDVAENIYPRCWDECISKSKEYLNGDYYTIIGSDDYLDPNYIKNAVNYIKETSCDFMQSRLIWISDDNKVVNNSKHEYSDINDLKNKMLNGCYVNTPTVFYKTETINKLKIQTNPKKYSGAADYDLFCQIIDKGYYIYNSDDWLGYYYRLNETQATWQMHKDEIKYDKLIQKKWKDKWLNNL